MANEETVWKHLNKHFNSYAVAGIMGNLYYESSINPKNLQNTYEQKLGMTDSSYTTAVDKGTYTNFIYDNAGYGIAQWTYWSHKKALLEFAKQKKTSIGDLTMQLDFLVQELTVGEYKNSCGVPLQTVKSVKEASDLILTKYEKPSNTGDSVKQKRAAKGQEYYNQYNKKEGTTMATNHKQYIESTGTHYISNSGQNENKGYHGGTAGDQTGSEWQLKGWYNRPWNVVLRFPSQAVGQKIAELSIDAALNNKIGYDQDQRTTYWKQLQAVGYQPSKITVACEQDCTAGVSSNVKAVGYLLNIPALKNVSICSSRDMRSVFTKAGFKALTDSKYLTSSKYLLPGDVLLYEGHHAAANVTIGSAVRGTWNPEAITEVTITEPELGERTLRKGDVGKDVKDLQLKLLALGYTLPKYGADGSYGNETIVAVKAFQQANGLVADGIAGPKTFAKLKNF